MDTAVARDSKPGNDGHQALSARTNVGISENPPWPGSSCCFGPVRGGRRGNHRVPGQNIRPSTDFPMTGLRASVASPHTCARSPWNALCDWSDPARGPATCHAPARGAVPLKDGRLPPLTAFGRAPSRLGLRARSAVPCWLLRIIGGPTARLTGSQAGSRPKLRIASSSDSKICAALDAPHATAARDHPGL